MWEDEVGLALGLSGESHTGVEPVKPHGVQALRVLVSVIAPVIPEIPFKVQKGLILQVVK